MALNSTAEIIEDIKLGKMVILMDDEDRENEGDIIMAAEHVTPEAINFMVKHARGLVCLPMTAERCQRLNLPLMVDLNKAQFSTNFTVSIEAAQGLGEDRIAARQPPCAICLLWQYEGCDAYTGQVWHHGGVLTAVGRVPHLSERPLPTANPKERARYRLHWQGIAKGE